MLLDKYVNKIMNTCVCYSDTENTNILWAQQRMHLCTELLQYVESKKKKKYLVKKSIPAFCRCPVLVVG